jgi:NTE family protein
MPGLDIHVGIWLALAHAGIVPSHLSGTSAGAIISAFQAAGRSPENAAAILYNLKDSDVRSERWFWKLRMFCLDSFLDPAPILKLLTDVCPAAVPPFDNKVMLWATNTVTGRPENLCASRYGSAASLPMAALASMSISGVFPPVSIGKDEFCDGGVRKNLPLPLSWNAFDEIYLLIASQQPQDYPRSKGILTRLIRNVQYLMQDQIEDVLDECARDPRVHVIWPNVHSEAGMLRFDHALIAESFAATTAILQSQGAA